MEKCIGVFSLLSTAMANNNNVSKHLTPDWDFSPTRLLMHECKKATKRNGQ
jgi:hypothetical protein